MDSGIFSGVIEGLLTIVVIVCIVLMGAVWGITYFFFGDIKSNHKITPITIIKSKNIDGVIVSDTTYVYKK